MAIPFAPGHLNQRRDHAVVVVRTGTQLTEQHLSYRGRTQSTADDALALSRGLVHALEAVPEGEGIRLIRETE